MLLKRSPDGKMFMKMAYCYPEQLYKVEEGKQTVTYRKAGSPTRLAVATDVNTWWEEMVWPTQH